MGNDGRAEASAAEDRRGRARKSPYARQQASLAARTHRWVGLTLGLVLVVCGLTGAYLAFYLEIEHAAIAPLRSSASVQPESFEAVYRALIQVGSPERGQWSIELPYDGRGGVITSRFQERGNPNRMVSVDPVTLAVVRDVYWGSSVSTWIYELHYRLLMGSAGGTVMGLIGVCLLAMLVAGIVLWWRSGRTLRSRLSFDRKGTRARKIFDIHRLLGLAGSVLLIVSVATATAINLPGQVRPVLTAFSPIVPLQAPRSGAAAGRARITVDEAIARARSHMPHADVRWVQVPNSESAPYAVRFWQPGEPSRRFPRSYVWLDQYDGRVLAVRDAREDTASDRILAWFYPLHSGEAFGLIGRIVVAVLGFTPAILFVTGFLRWRSKTAGLRAARRRRAAAHVSASANTSMENT